MRKIKNKRPKRVLRAAADGGQAAIDAIVTALREGLEVEWTVGHFWELIKTNRRWWWPDYRKPRAYLEAELDKAGLETPKPTELKVWSGVARAFNRMVTRRVGVSRLALALVYEKRAGISIDREDPGSQMIKVPVKGDSGTVVPKPLQICTSDEIREANRALLKKGPGSSPEDLALEKLLQAGLNKLIGDEGTGVIHLSHKSGKLQVSLGIHASGERLEPLLNLLKHL